MKPELVKRYRGKTIEELEQMVNELKPENFFKANEYSTLLSLRLAAEMCHHETEHILRKADFNLIHDQRLAGELRAKLDHMRLAAKEMLDTLGTLILEE